MKSFIVAYIVAFLFFGLSVLSLFTSQDYSGMDSMQLGLLFYIIAEIRGSRSEK